MKAVQVLAVWVVACFLTPAVSGQEHKPVVVVFDIQVQRAKVKPALLDGLSEHLVTRLAETGKFLVAPRAQIKERLNQQKKDSYRQCYDQACQIELGREMAADKALSTKVIKLGDKCNINLVLFDLKSAATDAAAVQRGGCAEKDLIESIDLVFEKLVGGKPAPGPEVTGGSTPIEPGDMVKVAAGWFWAGCEKGKEDQCASDEKPGHKVFLDGYSIDKSSVTVRQYEKCMKAESCPEPRARKGCRWRVDDQADQPMNCLSWYDAEKYCAWAGKRLPTEAEWEKAMREAGLRGSPGDLGQWMADWYKWDYYQTIPEKNPQGAGSGGSRVVRGGPAPDGGKSLRNSQRSQKDPVTQFEDVGFRCARSSAP